MRIKTNVSLLSHWIREMSSGGDKTTEWILVKTLSLFLMLLTSDQLVHIPQEDLGSVWISAFRPEVNACGGRVPVAWLRGVFFGRLVRSEFNPLCYCCMLFFRDSVVFLRWRWWGALCSCRSGWGSACWGGQRSLDSITSPQDWTPCCWGCRVTATTTKSHHCPRRFPASPTQRRTPSHRGNRNLACLAILIHRKLYYCLLMRRAVRRAVPPDL